MARSMRKWWMGDYEARGDFDFVPYGVIGGRVPSSARIPVFSPVGHPPNIPFYSISAETMTTLLFPTIAIA